MNLSKTLTYLGLLAILTLVPSVIKAQQTINGVFPNLANKQVKLKGFEGFKTYTIDSVTSSENGVFRLKFSPEDFGMGYLTAEDNKPFILILADDEDLKMEGEALAFPETVQITSGNQNQIFAKYATAHPRREQALNAWGYLEKIYRLDSLFTIHQAPLKSIEKEMQRIQDEDKDFLANLSPDNYVSWFLPVRKLVSSVSTIAQYRTEDIPSAIAAFRNMDYTDPRLYKSGLLQETIESHFWLLENSGRSLDSVFAEMKISVNYMIESLETDENKLNEITDYLFKLLERRSLFKASEYLALKLLNESGCTINSDLAAQLESYRAMKIGNIAPGFPFGDDSFAPGYEAPNFPQKLSDLKNNHKVIIFGSSWCQQCPEELLEISHLYKKWQTQGLEVIFVSLDEDKQVFKNFTSVFPFISICDYQKWESPVVKAYHVFATPTIFLLNEKHEILLRPNSVRQLDSWVDWYLVQGNK